MTEFVGSRVQGLRGSSSPGAVTLLVGCDVGDRDELADVIADIGGEVKEDVGSTAILVSLPKAEVDTLCRLDPVISVELDDEKVVAQGNSNFRPPTDSMM